VAISLISAYQMSLKYKVEQKSVGVWLTWESLSKEGECKWGARSTSAATCTTSRQQQNCSYMSL
jgi:hypothetical protein